MNHTYCINEKEVQTLLTNAMELALPALPKAPNMGLMITCNIVVQQKVNNSPAPCPSILME